MGGNDSELLAFSLRESRLSGGSKSDKKERRRSRNIEDTGIGEKEGLSTEVEWRIVRGRRRGMTWNRRV